MSVPTMKTDPELLALLERAKDHKMTPGEIHEQRRSWVLGEMLLAHPEMSVDEALAIIDRVERDKKAPTLKQLAGE